MNPWAVRAIAAVLIVSSWLALLVGDTDRASDKAFQALTLVAMADLLARTAPPRGATP